MEFGHLAIKFLHKKSESLSLTFEPRNSIIQPCLVPVMPGLGVGQNVEVTVEGAEKVGEEKNTYDN